MPTAPPSQFMSASALLTRKAESKRAAAAAAAGPLAVVRGLAPPPAPRTRKRLESRSTDVLPELLQRADEQLAKDAWRFSMSANARAGELPEAALQGTALALPLARFSHSGI